MFFVIGAFSFLFKYNKLREPHYPKQKVNFPHQIVRQ